MATGYAAERNRIFGVDGERGAPVVPLRGRCRKMKQLVLANFIRPTTRSCANPSRHQLLLGDGAIAGSDHRREDAEVVERRCGSP
jgi:hypothetical protein